MKSLAIIIVNWNTADLLKQCLDSIVQQEHNQPGFEILVVDNGSDDDSREMVQQWFPEVTLIENQKNIGFAAANNQAAGLTSAESLLFLNSDTIVHPGALEAMCFFHDSHPEVGVTGCQLLHEDGSLQGSFADFPSMGSALLGTDWRRNKRRYSDAPSYLVDAVSGACLLVKHPVWEAVGGMDEAFLWFGEEVDLCYRICQKGFKVCWLPEVRITHLLGQSRKQRSEFSYLQIHRSRLLFFRKHYGRIRAHLLRGGYVVQVLLKSMVSPVIGFLSHNRTWKEQTVRNRKLLRWLIFEQDVLV